MSQDIFLAIAEQSIKNGTLSVYIAPTGIQTYTGRESGLVITSTTGVLDALYTDQFTQIRYYTGDADT